MEAFLSTLPPYVHDFLNKQPATDVFNILRELVCFAVLYSNDRDGIQSATEALIKKASSITIEKEEETKQQQLNQEQTQVPEKAVVVVEEQEVPETIVEEPVKQEVTYNIRTGEIIQKNPTSAMVNTFPAWWGHQDDSPPVVTKKLAKVEENVVVKPKEDEAYGTSWISWESSPPPVINDRHHHRMERAKTQIIPDLRSYPDEDTARIRSSQTSPANLKRHSTLKSSITPRSNTPTTKNRLSSPVCESPVSDKPAKQKSSPSTSSGTSTLVRSSSIIKPPRENAAMRARAEHARMQQEELARKQLQQKNLSLSTNLRMKQRVNSGIDWETIKKERRNTIAAEPSKEKK